jgi:hypothetical protein
MTGECAPFRSNYIRLSAVEKGAPGIPEIIVQLGEGRVNMTKNIKNGQGYVIAE